MRIGVKLIKAYQNLQIESQANRAEVNGLVEIVTYKDGYIHCVASIGPNLDICRKDPSIFLEANLKQTHLLASG